MRNLLFHNRISAILLAKQEQLRRINGEPQDDEENALETNWDETDFPGWHSGTRRYRGTADERLSLREAFHVGLVGMISLLPALLIVMGAFVLFVWLLLLLWT